MLLIFAFMQQSKQERIKLNRACVPVAETVSHLLFIINILWDSESPAVFLAVLASSGVGAVSK